MDVTYLTKTFDLQPHPEGGFFREEYRSPTVCQTAEGMRHHCTSIYFLLPQGTKSNLHRLKSDEVWHFYLGGPMTIYQISPGGDIVETILGQDIAMGHKLQHVVPAGWWFGGAPHRETLFSFVGCTVAPGFDFLDFELGNRSELISLCPHARPIIESLTPQ